MKVMLIGPMNFRTITSCQHDWDSIWKGRSGLESSAKQQGSQWQQRLRHLLELLIVLELQTNVFGFLEEAKPTEGSSLEKHDMKTKIPQNPTARKNLRGGLCRVSPKLAEQGEQLLLCLHHRVLPPSRVLAGGAVSGGQNMHIPRIKKKKNKKSHQPTEKFPSEYFVKDTPLPGNPHPSLFF